MSSILPVSAQTSNITAIHPTSHPNLYFSQAEINQLRQAILVDRSPQYAVDAWNLIKNSTARGKPAQMDSLAWPDNYQAALPATQANFEATLSYLIEPTDAKAQQIKNALLSWTATQRGSWIADVQHGGHIHFALAFMYDALYNAGVLTTGEKEALDRWFQQTAAKTLLTNDRWQQRWNDGEPKVIVREESERADYPNWFQFRVMASVVMALVSHDQASVDAAANSPLPDGFFRLDTITQYAPATRDFKNMLDGLIYPSGYTWDGYARHYGFNAPDESYAGQQTGQGQHYHFFALMPVVLAAEAVAHNGFDAWQHNQQAIKRSFVTGKPWAHNAHRNGDAPGTVRNWLPFYWLVYRHFPNDPTIQAAVQDPRSRNSFPYTVRNSAPLWGVLGDLGENSAYPNPLASFTGDPTVGTAPLSVRFDAAASYAADGVIQTYAWAFGDGAIGTGLTAEHEYTLPGSYTVTLTVTDQHGGVASATQMIEVVPKNEAPQARFTASATAGYAPLTVHFDGSSSTDDGAISTYAWAFGDGATATGMTVSHSYATPGSFVAMLTVTDHAGLSSSAVTTITVEATPIAPIIIVQPVDAIVAEGGMASFVVTAAGAEPLLYQWQRNGVDIPGATSPVYTLTRVTATDHGALFGSVVTNNAGSSASRRAQLTVTANRAPTAHFTTNATVGQAPLQIHFDATASIDVDGMITAYLWDFGDGGTAAEVTTSYTYTMPGAYQVTLTVTDNVGTTASATTIIQVDTPPAPSTPPAISPPPTPATLPTTSPLPTPATPSASPTIVEQPADALVAEGEQVTLVVSAVGASPISYQWRRNGEDIVGATTPSYTIAVVGIADQNAIFSCVVTNNAGSVTSRGAVLTIIPAQPKPAKLLYLPLVTR